MKEIFDLQNAMNTFKFVFRLYNFVSLAQEDSHTLHDPFHILAALDKKISNLGYKALTSRKRKTRDDDKDGDGAGNGPPKKRDGAGNWSFARGQNDGDDDGAGNGSSTRQQNDGGLADSDILSDVAIQKALLAGYTIPDEVEGFESLLPVRVSFR